MTEPANDYHALMLSGEPEPIVYGCDRECAARRLLARFTADNGRGPVVPVATLIPCCRAYPGMGLMCHQEELGDEELDRRRLVLSLALARNEDETNVATWLATKVVDTETQFPPGIERMLREWIDR